MFVDFVTSGIIEVFHSQEVDGKCTGSIYNILLIPKPAL